MMNASLRHTKGTARRQRAQALVELALVMPVLVGIIAVLLQFGILFVAYLSLTHEMRDIGRWAAVHPDTIDGTSASCTNTSATDLWRQVCANVPSVVDPTRITFSVVQGADGQTRTCTALVGNKCSNRAAGVELRMRLVYDASSLIYLPNNFRLGPFLQVAIPTTLPAYDYSVMVEQH
ncbi:MAG TPA: TadE/TadG family type IV pilus assembly protein [Chloroflexota bacterium]|jgi:Flp pilus assembly protein TadG|nr:TadE/TadG family type IV pilus assembly protein [Chloroflexota bacterium]